MPTLNSIANLFAIINFKKCGSLTRTFFYLSRRTSWCCTSSFSSRLARPKTSCLSTAAAFTRSIRHSPSWQGGHTPSSCTVSDQPSQTPNCLAAGGCLCVGSCGRNQTSCRCADAPGTACYSCGASGHLSATGGRSLTPARLSAFPTVLASNPNSFPMSSSVCSSA